jgi:hypothetical protein
MSKGLFIPSHIKKDIAKITEKEALEEFQHIKEAIEAIFLLKKSNMDFKKLYE